MFSENRGPKRRRMGIQLIRSISQKEAEPGGRVKCKAVMKKEMMVKEDDQRFTTEAPKPDTAGSSPSTNLSTSAKTLSR